MRPCQLIQTWLLIIALGDMYFTILPVPGTILVRQITIFLLDKNCGFPGQISCFSRIKIDESSELGEAPSVFGALIPRSPFWEDRMLRAGTAALTLKVGGV